MTIVRGAAATHAVTSKHHLNPDDLKTASKLKPAINEMMTKVRTGPPLSPELAPHQGRESGWTAPNGDKLIPVQLSNPPPPGSADFPNNFALVNPKTNEFFSMTSGGITGRTFAFGPMSLPDGLKFKTKNMTAADRAKIEDAANHPATRPIKLPSKDKILGALGAYEFHKMVKYGPTGPTDKNILGKVKLKTENHPDGYTFTALVLKTDPNKVVIQRTGGLAGLTQYSQPLDLTRLPK